MNIETIYSLEDFDKFSESEKTNFIRLIGFSDRKKLEILFLTNKIRMLTESLDKDDNTVVEFIYTPCRSVRDSNIAGMFMYRHGNSENIIKVQSFKIKSNVSSNYSLKLALQMMPFLVATGFNIFEAIKSLEIKLRESPDNFNELFKEFEEYINETVIVLKHNNNATKEFLQIVNKITNMSNLSTIFSDTGYSFSNLSEEDKKELLLKLSESLKDLQKHLINFPGISSLYEMVYQTSYTDKVLFDSIGLYAPSLQTKSSLGKQAIFNEEDSKMFLGNESDEVDDGKSFDTLLKEVNQNNQLSCKSIFEQIHYRKENLDKYK
jgi:hypothetical protein